MAVPDRTRDAARWRWVGLAGSALVAAGALGAGVLPRPDPLATATLFAAVRSPAGTWVGTALAAAGMAVLVGAWLRLGGLLDAVSTPFVIRAAAAWATPLAVAPPILSRDVYAYAAAGDLVNHGMNPYRHGAADLPSQFLSSTSQSWYHVPFAYGPLFLLLAAGIVILAGSHLVLAVFGLRLLAVAGTALVAVALPSLARACGTDPRRALWLAVANPLLLAHFVGGAHADALMVGLLVVGLALAAGRWPGTGTAVVTLAVAVKATAGLALPFVVLLWARRLDGTAYRRVLAAAVRAGAVAGTVFGVLTWLSGLGYGWVSSVQTVALTRQWTSVSTGLGMGLSSLVTLAGLGEHADAIVGVTRAVGLLAAAGVAGVLWWRAARVLAEPPLGDETDGPVDVAVDHEVNPPAAVGLIVRAAGWALLALVLLGPVVHPWYVSWGLVVLAGAGVAGRGWIALVAGSAALCFLVLPDGHNLSESTVGFGVLVDGLLAVGGVAYGIRRLRRRRHPAARLPVPR